MPGQLQAGSYRARPTDKMGGMLRSTANATHTKDLLRWNMGRGPLNGPGLYKLALHLQRGVLTRNLTRPTTSQWTLNT